MSISVPARAGGAGQGVHCGAGREDGAAFHDLRSGHPEGRPALRQGGRPGRDAGSGGDRAVKAKLCDKEGAGWAELHPICWTVWDTVKVGSTR